MESFTQREREVLVKAIEALPGFVASFESGEVWKNAEARSLVAPRPPQPAEPSRFSCQVVLKLADRQHSYRLLGMGGTHCMVTGKDPIPENLLMQLEVACDPPLRGYASVKLSWPENGGWTLLVQPYGLTEGAQERWRKLAAEADAVR